MTVNPLTCPPRTPPQSFSKPALYAAIADLNRDLQLVLDDVRCLRQFRFRREFMDAVEVQIEELRAWSNGELLETQLEAGREATGHEVPDPLMRVPANTARTWLGPMPHNLGSWPGSIRSVVDAGPRDGAP